MQVLVKNLGVEPVTWRLTSSSTAVCWGCRAPTRKRWCSV